MKLGEAFPSKYVSSADLKGRSVRVIIASYNMEKLGDDTKLVLYFQGKEKGLVLNKTNANEIADTYSDDLDRWIGREIELFSTRVPYQGKMVDGIRIRINRQQPPQQQQSQQQHQQMPIANAQRPDGYEPEPVHQGDRYAIPEDQIPF